MKQELKTLQNVQASAELKQQFQEYTNSCKQVNDRDSTRSTSKNKSGRVSEHSQNPQEDEDQ